MSLSKNKNFKVGDIVCFRQYPGRDKWEQVGEIMEVHPTYYKYRAIQFRTMDSQWSTTRALACTPFTITRGNWEENQTELFKERTLEQLPPRRPYAFLQE
jgi:hypothetical protein